MKKGFKKSLLILMFSLFLLTYSFSVFAEEDTTVPMLKSWINPSADNTFKSGILNITVNITDDSAVDQVLVTFSNTNFSMNNVTDLWYYELNTTGYIDGQYNITVIYNDTSGNVNSSTLFNTIIDNTFPSVSSFNGIANNAQLEGIVLLNSTVTDASGLSMVFFEIINSSGDKSAKISASNPSENFWIGSLDTTSFEDGAYAIRIVAIDILANVNNLETINVSIDNIKVPVAIESKLRIKDLDVRIDGKTDKSIENNTLIDKEAKPGSKILFNLELENLFTSDEDIKIEDIEVEITIVDIDDDDDLEEESKEFDLTAEEEDDVKLEFRIPLEVDEDTFDVIIEVEGIDENGVIHEIIWNLELEVEKENHEIRISRYSIVPSTIKCKGTASINAEIINTGSVDEDDVTLEIINSELGISSFTDNIELEDGIDDNRFTKLVTASINNNVIPKTYPILINAYYDGKLSETKSVELTVQSCRQQRVDEAFDNGPEVVVILPAQVIEQKPSVDGSFVENFTIVEILLVMFLITFMLIIGAGFVYLTK